MQPQSQLFAEEMNYFDTTVHPAKSLGEIQEMLEDFHAQNVMVVQGQTNGRHAWLIRFMWREKPYRFVFTPHALFGFMEIATAGESGWLPPTAAELDVDGLRNLWI